MSNHTVWMFCFSDPSVEVLLVFTGTDLLGLHDFKLFSVRSNRKGKKNPHMTKTEEEYKMFHFKRFLVVSEIFANQLESNSHEFCVFTI